MEQESWWQGTARLHWDAELPKRRSRQQLMLNSNKLPQRWAASLQ